MGSFGEPARIWVRRPFSPLNHRSVRAAPVVALLSKRHQKRIRDCIISGHRVAGDADLDLRLRNVQAQGAMKPVPPRKDCAEIRVILAPDLGVVNAVHARRNQHFVQEPFKADWESQVTMVKEYLRLKGQLVNGKGPWRNADKTYLDHAKETRKCDLAKMKS